MALPNKCQNHLLIVLIGIFSADQISQGLYINNIGYLFIKLEKMHELCVFLYLRNNMEPIGINLHFCIAAMFHLENCLYIVYVLRYTTQHMTLDTENNFVYNPINFT